MQVKKQCDLKTPAEDLLRVIIRSDVLKAPISTRLLLSLQMTAAKVMSEITKVLQSNKKIFPLTSHWSLMW